MIEGVIAWKKASLAFPFPTQFYLIPSEFHSVSRSSIEVPHSSMLSHTVQPSSTQSDRGSIAAVLTVPTVITPSEISSF